VIDVPQQFFEVWLLVIGGCTQSNSSYAQQKVMDKADSDDCAAGGYVLLAESLALEADCRRIASHLVLCSHSECSWSRITKTP
jgi:hypothetical protein